MDADLTAGVHPDTAAFFIRARTFIRDNPQCVDEVDGAFQFIIKKGGGEWVIDMRKGHGAVSRGKLPNPSCLLTYSSQAAFHRINSQKTNISKELLLGRLRVSGNLKLLGKMQALIQSAASAQAAAQAREQVRQAEMDRKLRQPSYLHGANASRAGGAGALAAQLSAGSPPVWMKDDDVDDCLDCGKAFTILRRRHHCRGCGRIFCADCSSHSFNDNRVCRKCFARLQGVPLSRAAPRSRLASAAAPPAGPTPASGAALSPFVSGARSPAIPRMSLGDAGPRHGPGSVAEPASSSVGGGEELEDDPMAPALARIRQLESTVTSLKAELDQSKSMDLQPPSLFQIADRSRLLAMVSMLTSLLLIKLQWRVLPLVTATAAFTMYMLGARLLLWLAPAVFTVAVVAFGTSRIFNMYRRRFGAIAVGLAVWLDYRIIRMQTEDMDDEEALPVWHAAHVRNGIRIRHYCLSAQGLFIKLGQYLSTRTDIVAAPLVDVLTKLQSSARPQSADDVKKTIIEDLKKPIEQLFSELEDVPIATASIGQVHRGRLTDGTQVAIKIQHRGVAKLLYMDIGTLDMFLSMLTILDKSLDLKPIIEEWSREVTRELSFVNEARNTEAIAEHMRQAQLPVVLPRIIPGMHSDRVLVMEFINGIHVTTPTEMRDAGVDIDRFVSSVCEALAYQLYVAGRFNGDPHPGNFMLAQKHTLSLPPPMVGQPDPFDQYADNDWVPVLLDFGLVKELDDHTRRAFARYVMSAEALDYGGILDVHREIGVEFSRESFRTDMMAMAYMFRRSAPAQESRKQFKKFSEGMANTQSAERNKSAERKLVKFPRELVFHHRAVTLIQGLCSRLESSHSVVTSFTKWARVCLQQQFMAEDLEHPPLYPVLRPPQPPLHAKIAAIVERNIASEALLGVQVAVVHGNALVLDLAGGSLGFVDKRAVKPSTLFPCLGVSRVVPAAAAHVLAASRQLAFTDAVVTHWPEFAPHGKDACTIADLMRCRSGVEGALPAILETTSFAPADANEHWQHVADQEPLLLAPVPSERPPSGAKLPPAKVCGPEPPQEFITHMLYGWGWAVSALLSRASGSDLRACIKTHVAGRYGTGDELYMGVPNGDAATMTRVATVELSTLDHAGMGGDDAASSARGSARDPTPAPGVPMSPARRNPPTDGPSSSPTADADGDADNQAPALQMSDVMGGTTLATMLAALELGAVMRDGGLESLKALTSGGLEHFMDPRVLNNHEMRSGVMPCGGLYASARAVAKVTHGVSEDLLKAAMAPSTSAPVPGDDTASLPPPVKAVHDACGNLGFRPYTFASDPSVGGAGGGVVGAGTGAGVGAGAGAGAGAGGGAGSVPSNQSGGAASATVGFGVSALGGSIVLSVPEHHLTIAVLVNQLTPSRAVPMEIVTELCKAFKIGTPTNL